MKRIILLVSVIAGPVALLAQPTISSTQYASQTGTFSYNILYMADADAVPGAAGSNVTWNFSTLEGDTTLNSIVGLCPGASICSEFPEATQFSKTATGNSYTMFKRSSTSFEAVGSYNGVDPYYHNSNTEKIAEFPVTYSQAFTDNYASANATASVKGKVDYSVDGYGTLITRTGTYTNVLRIKRVKTDTTIVGATTSIVRATTYEWLKPGMPTIAGMMKGHILFPVDQVSQAVFMYTPLSDKPSSVNQPDAIDQFVSVYPNPASAGNLMVTVKDCKVDNIKMTDISGRVIYTEKRDSKQEANTTFRLPLQHTAPGMYLITVTTNRGTLVKKITII